MKLGGMEISLVLFISLFVTCLSAPAVRPAFEGAGQKEGIEIWRIEKFEAVPVKKADYGKFYEGDSYIVLSTKEDKTNKGSFTWDIHFWLGKSTTQDESGTAAILSVELDEALGGSPVQYREEQGHESKQFLDYFPSGIQYLAGGVKSGFKHTDTNARGAKKLYQVKGIKNVQVRLVAMDVHSLNNKDCFILDSGKEVYVWVGSQANSLERLKAINVANQIRDEDHKGRGKVSVVDASSTPNEVEEFFKVLGSGSPSEVSNNSVDDEKFEKEQEAIVEFYKISDASGKVSMDKITEKPLTKSMLKSEDCFIVDTGTSGIFVWLGRFSSVDEKIVAMKKGDAIIEKKGYPSWSHSEVVVQGGETPAFKQYFIGW